MQEGEIHCKAFLSSSVSVFTESKVFLSRIFYAAAVMQVGRYSGMKKMKIRFNQWFENWLRLCCSKPICIYTDIKCPCLDNIVYAAEDMRTSQKGY